MFDISQYNDGCSPALTFKTWPRLLLLNAQIPQLAS